MKKLEETYQTHFIHIEDIRRFLKKRKKTFFIFSSVSFIFLFILLSSLEIKFQLKASFREAGMKSENSSSQILQSLLKSSGDVDGGAQALTMMKSRCLLEKVIQMEGLQAEIKEFSLLQTLKKRWGKKARFFREKNFTPKVAFRLKEIDYQEPCYLYLKIKVLAENEVEISCGKEKQLIKNLSKKILFEKISFFLERGDDLQKETLIEIAPLEKTLDKVTSLFKVKIRREDSTLLDLSYQDKDPVRGVDFLNHLMVIYKNYLIQENHRISEDQLGYLLQRQDTISQRLDQTLQAHVKYLKESLGEEGFLGLSQELDRIEKKKSRYDEKKGQLHLHIATLNRLEKEKIFYLEDSFLGEETKKTQEILLGLKKQKQNLQLIQFAKGSTDSRKDARSGDKLFLTKNNKKIFFLDDKKEELIHQEKRALDPPFLLNRWENLQKEKALLNHLGKNVLELKQQDASDFEGLDTISAKEFYVSYVQKLDEERLRKNLIQKALEHLKTSAFELNGFADLIEDSMSQQIFKEVAELSLELQNYKYLSEKDQKRLKEAILIKKEILMKHLEQKLEVTEEKILLIQHKISLLQEVMLKLINQDIIIFEEQMQEQILQKKQSLALEKELIDEDLKVLQLQLQEIPHKWLLENKLQLQADLNLAIMEGMAKLIESKNIEHHLLQVESKTIDKAYVPLLPKMIPVTLYALIIAALFTIFFAGIRIVKKIYEGFPLSLEGLRYRGFDVVGPVFIKNNRMQDLRKISEFIWQHQEGIVSFILNESFNYIFELESLMRRSGKKILIVECFMQSDANFCLETLSGASKETLSEVFKGDMRKVSLTKKWEDGLEFFHQDYFYSFITFLRQTYDFIFFVTDKKINCVEAHKFIAISKKMVLTLGEEKFDDLYPYIGVEDPKKLLVVAFEF